MAKVNLIALLDWVTKIPMHSIDSSFAFASDVSARFHEALSAVMLCRMMLEMAIRRLAHAQMLFMCWLKPLMNPHNKIPAHLIAFCIA